MMDPATVAAAVKEEFHKVQTSMFSREYGWEYEFDLPALRMYVAMKPRKGPSLGKSFRLRVFFEEYPLQAPSYVFVDQSGNTAPEGEWPKGVAHSPGRICSPGTREFHNEIHKNDAHYPWSPERYPILWTLQNIFRSVETGGNKL